jgi:succinoglycan biosynthesis transport protein ExoP
MTQDERLVPARAGRELDRTLADLTQSKGYGGRYGSSPTEINLKQYLFVVLKRKWLIMSLVLIVTTLATIHAYREPSIYQGATTIKIEQKARSILQSGTGGGIVIGQNDPNFWGTQLRLLQNEALARQVVLKLDLQHNPAFFGPQGQSTIFASLKRIFSNDAAPRKSPAPTAKEKDEIQDQELTEAQLAALEPYEDAITSSEVVEPQPQTNLVIIRYHHTDPVLAQKVADALADVFVNNNQALQKDEGSKATLDLEREIAKYQGQVHEKEQAVFGYAKQYNLPLTDSPGANLTQQRVSTYSSQLLEAENQKRNLQAAYESAKNSPDALSIPEVQKDERIVKLREKITELRDKDTALQQKYTKEWPEVQQIEAQLAQLEAELKKAPAEVVASMKAKADAAVSQLKDLQSAYARESGLTAEQTKNVIELASKRADLASDQQYLNTLFQKRRELNNAVSGDSGTKVSVANYSRLPRGPVGPARMRTIILAFFLSLLAGVGLAFLLDFLDDTIKTVDDVDRYINLPALALIPAMRSDKPRLRGGEAAPLDPNEATALAMVKDVRSPIAESYRHLRTSLLLSSAGTPPRTILVTSSQPSEGKTTTAINTAFMLAQTGAKVLIMDCDLRRPRLHTHFNIPNTQGLTNCLSGNATDVDSVIQDYAPQPNLKLLPSGPMPPNPAELLGSEEMRKLLVTLSEKFNHVIVDSPPAISFTDASILSTFVDGVVLVVHGGRSSRAVVRRAKQQLLDIGAHIFGIVLNNVRIEKTQDYYYGGYYGYYKSSYYTSEEEPAAEEDGVADQV